MTHPFDDEAILVAAKAAHAAQEKARMEEGSIEPTEWNELHITAKDYWIELVSPALTAAWANLESRGMAADKCRMAWKQGYCCGDPEYHSPAKEKR